MSGTALPTAGRFRFVASDRTGRPWITLIALRGVHASGTGSLRPETQCPVGQAHEAGVPDESQPFLQACVPNTRAAA